MELVHATATSAAIPIAIASRRLKQRLRFIILVCLFSPFSAGVASYYSYYYVEIESRFASRELRSPSLDLVHLLFLSSWSPAYSNRQAACSQTAIVGAKITCGGLVHTISISSPTAASLDLGQLLLLDLDYLKS